MKSRLFAVSVMLLAANAGFAQDTKYPKAKVSFDDFKGLVAEVEAHRASRLIDLNTFLKMSKKEGVIIFDSRSDFRFDRIHLKGAKHLAFTDFTQENLKKVIPTFETTILIYCNNNFDGNQTDFASKVAVPRPQSDKAVATQFASQAKPLMMALNIPTYVNLYGYGYRNVYELHELVNVSDPRISFEGSIVEPKPAKIQFRLDDIRPDGLRGPPDGLVSVSYEFCVPADERVYQEVRRIDPRVQISPGSSGRIGCSKDQALCIGSTHQPRWRDVLKRLSALAYIAEIRECHFE